MFGVFGSFRVVGVLGNAFESSELSIIGSHGALQNVEVLISSKLIDVCVVLSFPSSLVQAPCGSGHVAYTYAFAGYHFALSSLTSAWSALTWAPARVSLCIVLASSSITKSSWVRSILSALACLLFSWVSLSCWEVIVRWTNLFESSLCIKAICSTCYCHCSLKYWWVSTSCCWITCCYEHIPKLQPRAMNIHIPKLQTHAINIHIPKLQTRNQFIFLRWEAGQRERFPNCWHCGWYGASYLCACLLGYAKKLFDEVKHWSGRRSYFDLPHG